MRVFTDIDAWVAYRSSLADLTVGFVPTMGALHAGHLALVDASRADNAVTIVSIFVNPTQFDESNDFEAYPVNYQKDLERLEAYGVDAVLLPTNQQIYTDNFRFKVNENEFSQQLCGAHRPGHFDGVLTVVMRLLNLVRPERAYFGEKDYQQLQLIRDMVAAFFMPVKIIACATIRETDGLAMSSRNQHLSMEERSKAALLYATIRHSADSSEAQRILSDQGFCVDYVEDIPGRRLAAVRLGETRLIDNVEI